MVARSLARTFERLGPTYVKLGQILSTRRDILTDDVVAHLERLQDGLAPAPFGAVAQAFKQELGVDVTDVFAELDPAPIGSASIACVYRGVLRDGTSVAVKVRRPGVAQLVALDLRLIRWASQLVARLPAMRRLPVVPTIDELSTCLIRQVDFRLEANANRQIRQALAEEAGVLVPALIDRLCSESILTMELLPIERSAPDQSRRPAVLTALRALYRLIFLEGLVHCDLHAGNLSLLPNGRAAIVDFGFVAKLPTATRRRFAEFFAAMATGDGSRCARITIDTAMSVPNDLPYAAFEVDVSALVARAAGATVSQFGVADFVLGMFRVQRRYGIVGTPTFTMAIVSLLAFEGIAKQVAGDLDFGSEAVPFILSALGQ